jgi:hypothetical protein
MMGLSSCPPKAGGRGGKLERLMACSTDWSNSDVPLVRIRRLAEMRPSAG